MKTTDERQTLFWVYSFDSVEEIRSNLRQHVGDEIVDFPCEGPGWYFGTFEAEDMDPCECALLVTDREDDAGKWVFTVRVFEGDARAAFRAIANLPVYGTP